MLLKNAFDQVVVDAVLIHGFLKRVQDRVQADAAAQ
jgi:hypothetical protein